MEKLSELKHGLEEAWHSVAEGWRHVRERAAGALTRFTPSSKTSPPPATTGEVQIPSTSWALLAGDVFEDEERVVVRLEVPGMEKHDLEIEVRSDVLVVRGEKRYEHESSEGRYRIRQCAYGSFHRAIPLPVAVQSEKARARYTNGVLRIELPKAEHVKGRRIEIRTD